MAYNSILVETRGKVGLVTLNRPKAMNALNAELLHELVQAVLSFDAEAGIGAILITGNERAFAAGADIKAMSDATVTEMLTGSFVELFDGLRKVKKPVIAAVAGYALGGGCELAMSCDMIVAAENARFGQPEVTIGVIPGAGGTQRLTRAVGKAIAMEMVLNNRTLSAGEALLYGLINRVVSNERYLDEALALASELAERAPLAVRLGKEAVNKAYELSLSEGLEAERRLFYMLFASQDQKEGMQAFVDKRKAEWQGK
ncbi:MAG: enoyl-CoA hydratase [Chloroflexi bacterium GWB2_49_20]|nr:MAG: enoyl-CoA hydratase [Chloroflexi bacterium GWB2_49_20]OGN79274.1 MAG: enoyl-CoA hydratase [Chloroflexi bacterium GWC2_49_37]OGN82956.1 MAG: enoyl-CoA hydratase [Chloroflexi bacterium GWD2_49_16]HCC78611.1 enoyl-CoA hydratase [Anaerolineae bacterium]